MLVTIDTLRGDHLGASGHPTARTRHLDRLCREGVQFAQAFSASPTTLPSHTSILTGAWPTSHGVPKNSFRVPDEVVTIPEMLSSHGFSSAAFVSSAAVAATANLSQGFDVYDFWPVHEVRFDQAWRPGSRTVHRATKWWAQTPGRKFLWVHVFEPHLPYEPPTPLVALHDPGYEGAVTGSMKQILAVWNDPGCIAERDCEHVASLYLGEVTAVDRIVGGLLRAVEGDSSVAVVLTADHGESLGERGIHFKHGDSVYPMEVHVPLVVCGGRFHRGLSDAVVRTIDIPGTTLSLAGVDADLPSEAGRLDDAIDAGEGAVAVAFASMPWSQASPVGYANSTLMRGVRTGRVAYVETPWKNEAGWFDRIDDPGEFRALASPPPGSQMLKDELDRLIDGAVTSSKVPVPSRVAQQLRSLGYVD